MERYAVLQRVLMVCTLAVLPAAASRGETAFWADGPDVDAWVYGNFGVGSGDRPRAPTFTNLVVDAESDEFFRSPTGYSSRLGQGVYAFETTDQVEAGIDPSRYVVESVALTVWANKAGPASSAMIYTDQPKTQPELLAEALGGGVTSQQPMELFGVGFRNGYDGFALGVHAEEGDRFDESSDPYPGGQYGVYPVAGDGDDGYVDVANSYTGGYSATAPGGETDPFTATPWSIGTTDADPGDSLTGITTFTFDLDLSQPGVTDYLQRSLAEGVVGFMLSSNHAAGELGQGGGAYPDWRTREGASGVAYPTLSIEYSILSPAGDYNADGLVDADDYAAWSAAYGSTVTPGEGADGNADGYVDAADYTVWRDALVAPAAAFSTPEPTSGVYVLGVFATLGFCAGTVRFTASPEGEGG